MHAAAWTKFLDGYLTGGPSGPAKTIAPSPDDYRRFLAGKPVV